MSRMRQKRKARAKAARAAAGAACAVEAGAAEAGDRVADDGVAEAAAAERAAEPDGAAAEAAAEPGGDAAEAAAEPDGDAAEASAEPDGNAAGSGRDPARLKSIVESLVFAADKPISVKELMRLCKERDEAAVEAALAQLEEDYAGRGVVLHRVAGGWQFRTSPANSAWVTQLVAGKPVRLTRAQLETLAIVAYRQPITKPEIEEIRGVDCGSPLHVLMERQLIRVLGKKEEPGRPLLYGTTREFLEFFQLNDLRDLPTLREFHELTEDSKRELEKLGIDADGDDAGAGGEEAPAAGEPAAADGEPAAGDAAAAAADGEPAGEAVEAAAAAAGDRPSAGEVAARPIGVDRVAGAPPADRETA